MVEVIQDVNLRIKEYQASLQQNPSNIFYQRVQSRNVSNSNCQFTISSPNKRSYLLSSPQIEWQFTFLRVDTTAADDFVPIPGTALPYNNDRDLISLKPVLPVANAISSITVSINGSTTTIAQPRRFMECISMLNISRQEAKKYFEAGYPEKMGGEVITSIPSITWAYNAQDNTMMDQYYDFASRQLRGDDPTGAHLNRFAANPNQPQGGTVLVTEPVICPPFDCYGKASKWNMPDWSPWKYMSKSIPNIDRLEIDIQFTKLDASLMFYFYGRGAGARPPGMIITAGSVAANLLLYWVETPKFMGK